MCRPDAVDCRGLGSPVRQRKVTSRQEAAPQRFRIGQVAERAFVDRFFAIFSQKEDPDGPINTDRPTFTPANTVVPPGRLQFESGFTYNRQQSPTPRTTCMIFPRSPCAMA